MAHTDETWFLYFHAGPGKPRGSKDKATIQTTNGTPIMRLEPDAGVSRRRPDTDEVIASFEDNARMAGASRDMYTALKDLVNAALDAGLPLDSPMMVNAEAAIAKAKPRRHDVVYEGMIKFRGTHDECFAYLLAIQGQSTDYAIKHGGWSIEPAGTGKVGTSARPEAEPEIGADDVAAPKF